mgnify:CR=1 FL=1
MRAGLQRQLGRVHLRLLDGVTLVLGESLAAEIHSYCVHPEQCRIRLKLNNKSILPCICWTLALDDLVERDVGLAAVPSPQGEAALLHLGLRVVPVLDTTTLNRNAQRKVFFSLT